MQVKDRSSTIPRSCSENGYPPVRRSTRREVGTRLVAGWISQTGIDSGSYRRRRQSLTNALRRGTWGSTSFKSQLI